LGRLFLRHAIVDDVGYETVGPMLEW
jgi:hypothetical protein